jgi:HD-like signal output (HDOD) protein
VTNQNNHGDWLPTNGVATAASPLSPPTNPPGKARILFVDDEPSMLRVLKMCMRSMNDVWEMEFANSGEEAVAWVNQRKFDVIVTDMRMPGINGIQLLNHVLRQDPHTVRIILSGYADLSEVASCMGLTHQFLEKPCTLEVLKDCLKRVTEVKSQLANDELCNLAGSLKSLPSVPALYLEITEALQSPNTSAQQIAAIASQDPGISAKLLQLSNSAFIGFSRQVSSVAEAVQLLGVGVIQSLAMAVPIFSAFSNTHCPAFSIQQVWEHSLQTGWLARRICNHYLEDSLMGEQAFCAGILHDVGKIILADGVPDRYAAVLKVAQETQAPLWEVEQQYFRATHADVGGYLLALWGLPIPLVGAVANHHNPQRCSAGELSLAGVVHIASALQQTDPAHPETDLALLDSEYLHRVGLDRQYKVWREERLADSLVCDL